MLSRVASGAYDGRYREKVVPDKKKQQSKKACRRFNQTKSRNM